MVCPTAGSWVRILARRGRRNPSIIEDLETAGAGFWNGGSVIKVRPRGNETVQQMLKRFKRLCQREGLIRDMKRHSYYEKPSERKRRQSRKSVRRVDKDTDFVR